MKLNLSKGNGSGIVSRKRNINFNFQPPSTFVFMVFHKDNLTKSCLSFDDLSAHKIL
jgi:hypothetical protein